MFAPFASSHITLCTERIPHEDGVRQGRSAEEILRRLGRQPGVVLADEVGMGKTFVAMAVAASIILDNPEGGPVVVMAPPSLRDKWPKDWEVFRQKCCSGAPRTWLRHATADSGVQFLKLLDDPRGRKAHIIFLTHGALHRALTDGYAKLAVIKRAFKGRSSLAAQRKNFHKFAGRLLRMDASVERRAAGLLGALLERPYEKWLGMIHRAHADFKTTIIDDPVPQHLQRALDEMESREFEPLVDELGQLPLRESTYIEERLTRARHALADVMSTIWERALKQSHFESPLVILDEAHHLKNPSTRLASLFIDEDAAKESEYFTAGALGGKFERMLFLTATPFQLGHAELIRVLERFEGIAWQGPRPPGITRTEFQAEIRRLAESLDNSQAAALRLDRAWGKLTESHVVDANGNPLDPETWWDRVRTAPGDGLLEQIVQQVASASAAMRESETSLCLWVLRHRKSRHLPDAPNVERRRVLPGAAIQDEQRVDGGLEIDGAALLPFLLAGRAQTVLAVSERGRALFAEGLASSFEAYFETRSGRAERDEDADSAESETTDPARAAGTATESAGSDVEWYLKHLDEALPAGDQAACAVHPKVRATTERAAQLWRAGEKVLIFCHYRATGRALRQHISARLQDEIVQLGWGQLSHLAREKVAEELELIGDRFFDTEGSLRQEVNDALHRIVSAKQGLESELRDRIVAVVRRFLRTPSFLVRYFDLRHADHAAAFAQAIERPDVGGLSLRQRIEGFSDFLTQLIPAERHDYLAALDSIQTGSHAGHEVAASFDHSERADDSVKAVLLPNVRLANGLVSPETRRRLLLAFNTPLFPEILVASSVLAEGVDLHLNCRHVIHHDLCWNPSTLEQRTGRVDRIGSKSERVAAAIDVYLPYVAATQDEKMYRVVRDRDRWFQIVMGERYEADEATTDRRAQRIPLPAAIQSELSLRLHV